MSKTRHDGALIRTFGVTFHSPQILSYPVHGWDQLIYASEGVLAVHVEEGIWTLPSQRALWVPDGITHSLHIAQSASLRALYFRARAVRHLPRTSSAVNVSPLLKELILACIDLGALSARKPSHRRLAAVIFDQMRTLPTIPLQLPMPQDPRAALLAASLKSNPAQSLNQAAARSGTSLRTLERLFEQQTGMPLGAWFRRLRLQLSLEHLAAGSTVTQAALHCGYSNPSAFVSMFRRELGVTPKNYFSPPQNSTRWIRN
jgi:AraC-like DNA-binding protein